MKTRLLVLALCAVVAIDVLLRLGSGAGTALAQTPVKRQPIAISATTTAGGSFLLYRLWSDGSIDVRLTNPIRDQLSLQEGWRAVQTGP